MNENLNKRFWEIDFLRGIAIIMMIIFHFLYDLNFFGILKVEVFEGFWAGFARLTAIIFILLVGISLTLSFSKTQQKNNYIKYFKRGLKVFSWGLLITLMTYIVIKEGYVVFGILHFIGLSIILAYPFLKFRYLNLFLGILIILIGTYLYSLSFSFGYLFWLGFIPHEFYSIDYFPLLPWFGVILIGIFLGNVLYPNYSRKIAIKDLSKFKIVRVFGFLGRKSLLIYLLHQPIILAVLYFIALT